VRGCGALSGDIPARLLQQRAPGPETPTRPCVGRGRAPAENRERARATQPGKQHGTGDVPNRGASVVMTRSEPRPPAVPEDRDACLHRYTVGLAQGWLDVPLTCANGAARGVVSKDDARIDPRYDPRLDARHASTSRSRPPQHHPQSPRRPCQLISQVARSHRPTAHGGGSWRLPVPTLRDSAAHRA